MELELLPPTDPRLNRRSRFLGRDRILSDETQELIDAMEVFAGAKTLPDRPKGKRLVGLAAMQVGHPLAIALVDMGTPDDWSGELTVMINPRIEHWSGAPCRWWHACVSCGPLAGTLQVWGSELWLRGFDRFARRQEWVITNVRGVHAAWHEIEHIAGRRFPDLITGQGGRLDVVQTEEYPQYGTDVRWPRQARIEGWKAMKRGDADWESKL